MKRCNRHPLFARPLYLSLFHRLTSLLYGWLAICFIVSSAVTTRAIDSNPLLSNWLAAQTNLHSWTAEVTQTRTFKTLAQPLVAHGHIWFVAPNLFRWELGQPAQTIAVRQPGQMLVLYPRLKRAERYPLDASTAGPWRDLLMLLEAGFPRNQADLEAHFKILSVIETNGLGEVRLQPKSAIARRMIPEIKIVFVVKDSEPRATELKFADGSTMRNDFTNSVLNSPPDPALFKPVVPPDFKVTEPLHATP